MTKKITIIFSAVLLLTILNTAPLFMINCTEPDGSSHLENVFNRCCGSSMIHKDHMSMNHIGISLGMSRCKCSVDTNSGEYIVPNIEKYSYHKVFITGNSESSELLQQDLFFSTLTTESPPISIDLISSTVLLI